ncbi:MAG: cytochrome c biogenesis protein CcsA [Coriobacteriia bacterium]
MFSPETATSSIDAVVTTLSWVGRFLEPLLAIAALVTALVWVVPQLRRAAVPALAALTGLLAAGEVLLVWFHFRLWQICQVVDPFTGLVSGSFAVPLWVESEKLYVWALILAVITLSLRRHRAELQPMLACATALLVLGAVLWSRPFTDPLPSFLGQYRGYLEAWMAGGPAAAAQIAQGLEGSRRFFYNTWYMWVHPPLLFIAYGAFVTSFAATVRMIRDRRSSFEQTAYRWARFGYLPLTLGMLLGFPWAILAWSGESWWWSGKVNMSIMMWLLYTAYLHARLYLRPRGMWKVVAALAVLSFVTLLLTYVTTYLVPGAHSVV